MTRHLSGWTKEWKPVTVRQHVKWRNNEEFLRHLRNKIILLSSSAVFYRLVRRSKLSSVSARVLVLLWGVSSVGSSPLFTRQQRMWHRFPEHGVLSELNPPSSPRLCGRSADPNKSSLCPGAECGGGITKTRHLLFRRRYSVSAELLSNYQFTTCKDQCHVMILRVGGSEW